GRVRARAEALPAAGSAASAPGAPASGPVPATAHGPALTVLAGGDQLCQHHCPVAHVAAEFPQLCEAETEAFGRLLGTPVQRLATIAHGDGICTTHVTDQSLVQTRTTIVPANTDPATTDPRGISACLRPRTPSLTGLTLTSLAGPTGTRPARPRAVACPKRSCATSRPRRTSPNGCSTSG